METHLESEYSKYTLKKKKLSLVAIATVYFQQALSGKIKLNSITKHKYCPAFICHFWTNLPFHLSSTSSLCFHTSYHDVQVSHTNPKQKEMTKYALFIVVPVVQRKLGDVRLNELCVWLGAWTHLSPREIVTMSKQGLFLKNHNTAFCLVFLIFLVVCDQDGSGTTGSILMFGEEESVGYPCCWLDTVSCVTYGITHISVWINAIYTHPIIIDT